MPHDQLQVRDLVLSDVPQVAAIYNHYIASSVATFEEQAVSRSSVQERVEKVRSFSLPWLVAKDMGAQNLGAQHGQIVGYAYARPWHERSAYRFSVETSLYVRDGYQGQGVGTALYRALLADLGQRNLSVAVAGIALPNPASVALHERFGFEKVAHFRKIGFKFNRPIDVAYFQCFLSSGSSMRTSK